MKKLCKFLGIIAIGAVIGFTLAGCSSEDGGDPLVDPNIPTAPRPALTTVWASDESPTGFYVTFRYKAPDADSVRIYGEWAFTDMAYASVASSAEDPSPENWKDGYVCWTTGSWPTADMILDTNTGIWSYTIPLPHGTYNYRFSVGGTAPDYFDAKTDYDPANTLYKSHEPAGGEEFLTSVYVPWHPVKQAKTVKVLEEAPRDGQNGSVSFASVKDRENSDIPFGIYRPYGFDQARAEKYPVLILYHGGGGYEASWFNNGLVNILDNMIADGRLEPTVVVTPLATPTFDWNRDRIVDTVVNKILPYMAQNYNVSTDPNHRGFAGLSMGGATTMYAFFNVPTQFKYFMALSAPLTPDIGDPDLTNPNYKTRTLFFGYGQFDFVLTRSLYRLQDPTQQVVPAWSPEGSLYQYLFELKNAGIPYTNQMLPYGHQWTLWRQNIVYIFDNVLWK
jgi:enterochelin esterase-like enzyme